MVSKTMALEPVAIRVPSRSGSPFTTHPEPDAGAICTAPRALTNVPTMALYVVYPVLGAFSALFIAMGLKGFKKRVLA